MDLINKYIGEAKEMTFKKDDLDQPDRDEFKLIKKGESFQVKGKTYIATKKDKDTITGKRYNYRG